MYPEPHPRPQFPPPPPGRYPHVPHATGPYPPAPAHGYYAPAPAPPAARDRTRRIVVGTVVGLIALFLVAGVSGRGSTPPTVTEVPAAAAVPAVAAPDAPGTGSSPAAPAGIGDGTHIVGTDIQPGTYRSSGAAPGLFELCVWSTKDGPASNSDIIDLGSANANEPQVVEIGPEVGAFEANGCTEWQRVG